MSTDEIMYLGGGAVAGALIALGIVYLCRPNERPQPFVSLSVYSIRIDASELEAIFTFGKLYSLSFCLLADSKSNLILNPIAVDVNGGILYTLSVTRQPIYQVDVDKTGIDPARFNLGSTNNPTGLDQIKALLKENPDGYFKFIPNSQKFQNDPLNLNWLCYSIEMYDNNGKIPNGSNTRLYELNPCPPARPYQ